jgi:HPt (histidine-containing phosphotransfer) domain-containing protein
VLDELNVMLGGEDDPAFLRELVTEFFQDALGLVDEMRQAVTTGDVAAFGRAAHTLKSSSAMFGATAFAAVCQEAETLSATVLTDEAVEKFSWIEASYPQIKRELEAHIG